MLVPKLRFKREDGTSYPEWKRFYLEDTVDFLDEKRKPITSKLRKKGQFPYYGASGIIDYIDDFIFNEELVLLSEDGANIVDRNYRVAFIATGKYWVNNHAHCLRTKEGFSNYFISEALENIDYTAYNTGSAQPKLNQEVCRNLPLICPCLEEQQKIADFLSNVDEAISQSEAEVRNLEQQKKAAMQKIFSQEMRFKREDGTSYPEWNGKSFSNTFSQLNNNTFSRDMLSENGTVCNIHYGDVLVKFGEVCNIQTTDIPKVNADIDTSKFDKLQDGDVIFADTAEDEIVGKATEIYCVGTSKVISGLHTMACRPNEKYAPKYLGYYINSPTYHNQLIPFMQGIKVTSISRKNIADTVIYYPIDIEEQQKIADFLSSYDEAITYAKQELDKWKELKKGLLQQMFV